jgi:hypothetical protein
MCVHLLMAGGKTEWRWVLWGKHSLDELRKQGYAILGYHE